MYFIILVNNIRNVVEAIPYYKFKKNYEILKNTSGIISKPFYLLKYISTNKSMALLNSKRK